MPNTLATMNNTNSNPKIKSTNTEKFSTLTPNQVMQDQQQEAFNLMDKQHVNSTGNKTPQEQPEFIKQALIIIEKKVRNLEKRRIKLDEYKSNQKKGERLNEDQLNAVSRYDEVMRTLELTRELEKQFVGLANDAMRQHKKQAKKEQIERDESIKDKLKEALKFISVLNKLNEPRIRSDFLNETNRAFKMSENELNVLDEFNNLIKPCELGIQLDQSTSEVAEHLISLVDGRNKPVNQINNLTYQDLKKLLDRILSSSYWTNQETEENTQKTFIIKESLNLNLENNQIHNQINEKETENDNLNLENKVIEQITSEDFILVSTTSNSLLMSNDSMNEHFQKSNTLQLQPKTFFTTLNPADLSTNFLNRNENTNEEGLNFLQDSELQLHQSQPENNQLNLENMNQNLENSQNNFKQQRSSNRDQIGSKSYQKHRFNEEKRNTNNINQRSGQSFNNNRNQNDVNPNLRSSNQNRNNYFRGSSNNNNTGLGKSSNQRTGSYRNQEQFQQLLLQN